MQNGKFILFQSLICGRRGNTSIVFGLLLLPIVGLIGLSIDYVRAMHAHSELQEAAAPAAIAGARLPATANYNRYEAATKLLAAGLELTTLSGVTPRINTSNAEVVVEAEYAHPTVMLGLMGIEELQIKVSTGARSQIENRGVACLLCLSETSSDGLHLQGINQAAAENCWAWVNSSSATSINADGAAKATAQGCCTVGGTSGAAHFGPAPYTACAPHGESLCRTVREHISGH
jgi:Flp pilus assembly protein TadG